MTDIPNWTCAEGARGHVNGHTFRVPGIVVQIAPASIAVRYAPPGAAETTGWFNTMPGKRYLHRHGDTAEWGLRFEPEENVSVPAST